MIAKGVTDGRPFTALWPVDSGGLRFCVIVVNDTTELGRAFSHFI